MPDVVGRLRSPRLATAPSSPAVGELYYDTATSALFWWNGTAWVPARGASFATSLPGSPYDGQEAMYQSAGMATDGIVWCFRYRSGSASSFKWEFIGGRPLFAEVIATEATASTTYAALTTAGPSITVPLAGDYDVEVGGQPGTTVANNTARASYDIGATPAVDDDGYHNTSGLVNIDSACHRVRRKTGLAASTALVSKYKVINTGSATFRRRYMLVTPVRVS